MTTFLARHGHSTTHAGAAVRTGLQRFTHSLVSFGAIVRDAVDATRALNDAHTAADRRAVAHRFAAGSTRDAGNSAA